MASSNESAARSDNNPLTADLAFVIQLQRGAPGDCASWQGRVEHVISGESRRFSSAEDLFGLICELVSARQGRKQTLPSDEPSIRSKSNSLRL